MAFACESDQAANKFMDTALATMRDTASQKGFDPARIFYERIILMTKGEFGNIGWFTTLSWGCDE